MKTGNTSAHEFASRTSARGYTIRCVATVTSLALVLNAGLLAQGTQAVRNTRQVDVQGQATLARLIVPITGTLETAAATTQVDTLTTQPVTATTTTGLPTIPLESPTTLLAPEVPAVDVATTPDVTGSFSIRRFARTTDDRVAAVGMLTLSFTDPTTSAARTIVTELAMPITSSGNRGTLDIVQTQPLRPNPSAATQSCETLSLVFTPLALDVVGNPIQLNQTSLDIVAVPGTGTRFRNVVCDVANLINTAARSAEIVRRLNTLLETIG
jgi:hypothetical protein